jgi:adenine deaminase
MQGGQVVVKDGEVLEALALPIAGLMSRESLEFVNRRMKALHKAARALGCALEDPFMTMAFMALPVIPEIKLTDKGLVDVTKFKSVPLFGE